MLASVIDPGLEESAHAFLYLSIVALTLQKKKKRGWGGGGGVRNKFMVSKYNYVIIISLIIKVC